VQGERVLKVEIVPPVENSSTFTVNLLVDGEQTRRQSLVGSWILMRQFVTSNADRWNGRRILIATNSMVTTTVSEHVKVSQHASILPNNCTATLVSLSLKVYTLEILENNAVDLVTNLARKVEKGKGLLSR
jgi:hypothetical protein